MEKFPQQIGLLIQTRTLEKVFLVLHLQCFLAAHKRVCHLGTLGLYVLLSVKVI